MDKDENREPQQDDELQGDLEVSSDEAEGVAGGKRVSPPEPEAGLQRA